MLSGSVSVTALSNACGLPPISRHSVKAHLTPGAGYIMAKHTRSP